VDVTGMCAGSRENMMSPTRVSVVIPTYNQEPYLREAIDSVLAQDYPHVEIIVVDDGSTDGTKRVLESYGSRILWWSRENRGQSATLNEAWARASGDVLGYLSSDDRLAPSAVREAVETLQADPSVVVTYCDYELIDAQSRHIRTVSTRDFDYEQMIRDLECVVGPGAFFRRAVFRQTGGWSTDLRHSADFDYWLRAALLGRLQRIPAVLAGMRVHEQSQSFMPIDSQRSEEAVAIVDRLFERTDLPPHVRVHRDRAKAISCVRTARHHFRAGRYATGARWLARAGRVDPTSLFSYRTTRLLLNALINRSGHRMLQRYRSLSLRRSR
jgi:glycosyltransferase involved in cell wall biosynthesis